MIQITTLTSSANQQISVVLGDKSVATFTFTFRPRIQRWSMNVSYNNTAKQMSGLLLVPHPNLLRAFRNTWPFGLAVVTTDGADPFRQDDFTTGRVTLYVLDQTGSNTDVSDIEDRIFS